MADYDKVRRPTEGSFFCTLHTCSPADTAVVYSSDVLRPLASDTFRTAVALGLSHYSTGHLQ